jgi:hypothetical protein
MVARDIGIPNGVFAPPFRVSLLAAFLAHGDYRLSSVPWQPAGTACSKVLCCLEMCLRMDEAEALGVP